MTILSTTSNLEGKSPRSELYLKMAPMETFDIWEHDHVYGRENSERERTTSGGC